jgi:hypothetical protein
MVQLLLSKFSIDINKKNMNDKTAFELATKEEVKIIFKNHFKERIDK